MEPIVQVAGVIDAAEAAMLVECGVDRIGFPFHLPVHREDIAEGDAAAIVRSFPPSALGVLITYLAEAREILSWCRRIGVSAVQLHGEVTTAEMQRLKEIAPALQIIKSLVVREDNLRALQETVRAAEPYVEAFITDTYDPVTGACGATGRTHDWRVSQRLVEFSPKPVILAGGLDPRNVRQAILAVQPAGVDVHTGVENAAGRKDRDLVRMFVSEARSAFAAKRLG
jgi:phosphoribosylanthranilate isomerase